MTRANLLIVIEATREGLEALADTIKNTQSGDVINAEVNALLDELQKSLTGARLGGES